MDTVKHYLVWWDIAETLGQWDETKKSYSGRTQTHYSMSEGSDPSSGINNNTVHTPCFIVRSGYENSYVEIIKVGKCMASGYLSLTT